MNVTDFHESMKEAIASEIKPVVEFYPNNDEVIVIAYGTGADNASALHVHWKSKTEIIVQAINEAACPKYLKTPINKTYKRDWWALFQIKFILMRHRWYERIVGIK